MWTQNNCMSILSDLFNSLIGKNKKISSNLTEELFQCLHEYKRDKPSDTRKNLAKLMQIQAFAAGQRHNHFSGDSIAQGMAHLNTGIPSYFNSGIGGDTIQWLDDRFEENILITRPSRFAFHITGNNFLGNDSMDYTWKRFKSFAIKAKKYIGRVAWVETIPLGNPFEYQQELTKLPEGAKNLAARIPEINLKFMPEFALKVRMSGLVEVIDTRKYLQNEFGFIYKKYNVGDMVHINEEAYKKFFIPALKKWFES